jgi:citrate lyase beta subunit
MCVPATSTTVMLPVARVTVIVPGAFVVPLPAVWVDALAGTATMTVVVMRMVSAARIEGGAGVDVPLTVDAFADVLVLGAGCAQAGDCGFRAAFGIAGACDNT